MRITDAMFALSVYNNAQVDYTVSRCQKRRRDLQIVMALALQQYAMLTAPPKPCQRCDGRGVIEGHMQWSYTAGYCSNASYPCPECCEPDEIEF